MDIQQLIEQFGMPGLIIGALIWDRLRMMAAHRTDIEAVTNRLNQVIDGRIEDQKQHADQIVEVSRAMDRARHAIERRGNV